MEAVTMIPYYGVHTTFAAVSIVVTLLAVWSKWTKIDYVSVVVIQ